MNTEQVEFKANSKKIYFNILRSTFLLLCFVLLFSCKSDDEVTTNVEGKWQLIKLTSFEPYKVKNYDYQTIVYDFQANNVLVVSGESDPKALYENGSYDFKINKDYIKGMYPRDDKKVDFIDIKGSKFLYTSSNSQLTISIPYADGGTYEFVRYNGKATNPN